MGPPHTVEGLDASKWERLINYIFLPILFISLNSYQVICDLRPVIRAIESKFYNIYFCLSPWLRDSDVGPPAYAANTTPTESSPHPVWFLQDVFTEILHHH